MNTLKTIVPKPFCLFLLTLAFSCTIIQDSDITTESQLAKLKIMGLEIIQQTSKGNGSTLATLLYDSTVNITDAATGAKLTRRIRFSLPALGTLKMKLKSGVNIKTELQVYYMDDGQPYTVRIFQGDSSVEHYRFRYDTYTGTRKLNKFTTILDPVDNLPPTYTSVDNFTYTGSNISSILRSPSTGSPVTINIAYGGSGTGLSVSSLAYQGVNYSQLQGNCPNNSTFDTCTGYSSSISGIGGSGSYTLTVTQNLNFLSQINLGDNKANGSSNNRDYDTYYFHPLMILRNQVRQGNYLLVVYMIDWWKSITISTNISNPQNEFVSVNLKYGL